MTSMTPTRFTLPQDRIPTAWYNALRDLPEPLQPPLHPGTREPAGPADLAPLFPMALIEQEMTQAPTVEIPGAVIDILRQWRPTPLVRALRLEEELGTPGTHLLQRRVGVAVGVSQDEHGGRAGVLQPRRGHQAHRDRDGRGAVGERARLCLRAVRNRVQGLHGARLL